MRAGGQRIGGQTREKRREFVFYNLLIVSTLQKAVNICLDYCKKNPILAAIIGVLGLALIGLIIAIPCVASSCLNRFDYRNPLRSFVQKEETFGFGSGRKGES